MEKIAYMSMLFDVYGSMLTDKKRQTVDLYLNENMSLAEIAEEFKISRSAVHDAIQSSEQLLMEYERTLKILSSYETRRALKSEMLLNVQDIKEHLKLISCCNCNGCTDDEKAIENTEALQVSVSKLERLIDRVEE